MAATHPAKNSVPGNVLCSEASPNQFLSKLRGRKTRSFGKGDTFARLPRIWSKATCCLFYPQMMTAKTFRKNVVPTKSPIFCWKPFLNEDIVSKSVVSQHCLAVFDKFSPRGSEMVKGVVGSGIFTYKTKPDQTLQPTSGIFHQPTYGEWGISWDIVLYIYVCSIYKNIYISKHHILLYLYGILLIPKKMLM